MKFYNSQVAMLKVDTWRQLWYAKRKILFFALSYGFGCFQDIVESSRHYWGEYLVVVIFVLYCFWGKLTYMSLKNGLFENANYQHGTCYGMTHFVLSNILHCNCHLIFKVVASPLLKYIAELSGFNFFL